MRFYLHITIALLLVCSAAMSQDPGVQSAEYFVDTDPGQGLGIALNPTDGSFNDLFESGDIDLSLLSNGLHSIGIRFQDNSGNWSEVFSSMVSIEPDQTATNVSVTQAEYFWDTDPGEGNASPMLAFDGNFDEAFESVFQNGISNPGSGLHKLNVRIIGDDGLWSNVFSNIVSFEANNVFARDVNITQAEYFWDTDPGEGNGSAMLAFDGNFDEALESVFLNGINNPGNGLHRLNIRLIGDDGIWSNVFSTVVSFEADIVFAREVRITQAEYFWDTDPGEGNGSPMLAFDGNYEEAFESVFANAISYPGSGLHTLNFRVRGDDGVWANLMSSTVSFEDDLTARDLKVTQMEYFWDIDPGEGSGSPLLAVDGAFDNAFEAGSDVINTNDVGTGLHTLNVRTLGLDGSWSNVFQHVVYIDDCPTLPVVEILQTGPLDVCDGVSVQLDATAGFDNYRWLRGITEVANGTDDFLIVTTAGYYYVEATDTEGCIAVSEGIWVEGAATPPAPVITADGPTEFCDTESVNLNASGTYPDYEWSEGSLGTTLNVNNSGTYFVEGITVEGCRVESNSIVITVEASDMWYPDVDMDGFGDMFNGVPSCEPIPDYILNGQDCFDDDPNVVLCCPGDLNEDGFVTTADLLILLSAFGSNCGSPFCTGDLNGDSLVTTADLLGLLSNYGGVCDP